MTDNTSQNILIIDSDPVSATLATAVFDNHCEPWAVSVASSASEAKVMLGDASYPVVILAMTLTDGCGLDLLYDGSIDSRVIMMASTFGSQYQFEAYSAGADEHIEKTVGDLKLLPELVSDVITQH